MIQILLTVIISSLVLATGIITATYDLRDKTKPRFLESLNGSGRLVLVLTILTMLATVAQYWYTDYKTEVDITRRDSIIRSDYFQSVKNITSNYEKSTTNIKVQYDSSTANIIKALARYGLKYDSARNRIEKLLKDSVTRTVDNPFIQLCVGNPESYCVKNPNGTISFHIRICNTTEFVARNVDITVYWIQFVSGKPTEIGHDSLTPEKERNISPFGVLRFEQEFTLKNPTPDFLYSFFVMNIKNASGRILKNTQFLKWDIQNLKLAPWEANSENAIREYLKSKKYY